MHWTIDPAFSDTAMNSPHRLADLHALVRFIANCFCLGRLDVDSELAFGRAVSGISLHSKSAVGTHGRSKYFPQIPYQGYSGRISESLTKYSQSLQIASTLAQIHTTE